MDLKCTILNAKSCFFFALLLVAHTALAQAQQDNPLLKPVDPRPRYTFSLAAGGTMANSAELDYTHAADFGFVAAADWQMTGTEYWKRFWNHPRFGTHIEYLHTLDGVAGDRIALAFQMQNPVWRSKKTAAGLSHEVFWYTGAGLALFTEPYERTLDTLNKFIGSYLNCIFNLGAGYSLTLPDESALTFSVRFSHSSNGYLKKPNKGLNYLLATAGYRLKPMRREPIVNENRADSLDFDEAADLQLDAGLTEFKPPMLHRIWGSFAPAVVQSRYIAATKDYYFAYTGQIGYAFYLNPCIGFGVNLDMMYNNSHTERLYNEFQRKKAKPPYLGVAVTFEPRWGIMSVRLSVGYYVRRDETVSIPMYERLGVFFHFGKKINQFAGVTIKAHAAHADYIEWHYGFELFIPQPKRCVPAQGEVIL